MLEPNSAPQSVRLASVEMTSQLRGRNTLDKWLEMLSTRAYSYIPEGKEGLSCWIESQFLSVHNSIETLRVHRDLEAEKIAFFGGAFTKRSSK